MAVRDLKTIATQMEVELVERIDALAERNDRTRSAELRIAAREHVEREEAKTEKAAA